MYVRMCIYIYMYNVLYIYVLTICCNKCVYYNSPYTYIKNIIEVNIFHYYTDQ